MMKHNFKIYAAMACTAIALASCSSEAIEDTKTVGKQQMMFTAQQETNVSSRTSLGDDLSVLWAGGDALSVFDGSSNNAFELSAGAETSTAQFSGTAEPADNYYAVYPYQDGATLDASTIKNVEIPATQTATLNSFDPLANIMTAVSTSANNLAFKNVCSYAKITTTAACKKITITAGASDKIAGKFDMSVGADGIATATATTNSVNTVTLVPSSGETTFANGTYYIAMKPGTMSALKVECEYSSKTVYQSINAAVSIFTRANIIDMGTTEGWPEVTQSINGHDYVVIGGKKWATMNVGATTVAGSPTTCYGDYFAWGETEPRYTSITFTSENRATITWKSEYQVTKGRGGYQSDNPSTYTGNILDAEHDAATAKWGGSWRTPTINEYMALFEACGGTGDSVTDLPSGSISTTAKGIYWCADYNGVKGILFCDGVNKVFFPIAYSLSSSLNVPPGPAGYYWTSSLYTSDDNYVNIVSVFQNLVTFDSATERYDGLTVRPVSD